MRLKIKLAGGARGKVTFDVFSWDDPAAGVPLLAGMTPQEAVNRVDRPADCDITIVILWSRLGSPLRTDVFRKPNGEPYGSGTEWEYEDARTASRDVLIYRRTATISAWYRREDWETLRDLFPDRSALHATYDEWEADARRVERQLGAQGLAVERIIVDPAEFSGWCAPCGASSPTAPLVLALQPRRFEHATRQAKSA